MQTNDDCLWSFLQKPPQEKMRLQIDDESSSQAASKKFLRVIRKARRMARGQSIPTRKQMLPACFEPLAHGMRSASCYGSEPYQTSQQAEPAMQTTLFSANIASCNEDALGVHRHGLRTEAWIFFQRMPQHLMSSGSKKDTSTRNSIQTDFSCNLDAVVSFLQQPSTEKLRFRIDEERASQAESQKFRHVTRKARRMA